MLSFQFSDKVEEIIPYVDLILIMTVEPGFAGQRLIKSTIAKVERLRSLIDTLDHVPLIEVDGGINLDNVAEVAKAGADVLVSGSGIFKTDSYAETIREMRRKIEA